MSLCPCVISSWTAGCGLTTLEPYFQLTKHFLKPAVRGVWKPSGIPGLVLIMKDALYMFVSERWLKETGMQLALGTCCSLSNYFSHAITDYRHTCIALGPELNSGSEILCLPYSKCFLASLMLWCLH